MCATECIYVREGEMRGRSEIGKRIGGNEQLVYKKILPASILCLSLLYTMCDRNDSYLTCFR